MAQHDYSIADQSAAAVRADLNNALGAIATNNSGAAEPSTTYAYQWYVDTSTGTLRIRNAANNGWVSVGAVGTANLGMLPLTGGSLEGALLGDPFGAAATPSFCPDSADTNTGFYGKAADQLGVSAGGTEIGYFASTGWVGPVVATSFNGGRVGFRNLLHNARFVINQRGYVSGTATTVANQYTLDRWRVVVSGQNVTFADSDNIRTVTAPAGGIEQVIEGINIQSGTYTLNWTGTATATVAGGAVTKGGNVTLTGNVDVTVRFSSGTVSVPQLEPGSVATPAEFLPRALDLSMCQRYFEVAHPSHRVSNQLSGEFVYTSASFRVEKRATPTLVVTTSANVNLSSVTNNADLYRVAITGTVTASGTVALDQIIACDAEL
jgi:hypothetical protein